MGFFEKLLRKGPGSPISIAKTVLNAYNRIYENSPLASKEEALRFAIESRYRIIQALKQDEIEDILKISNNLADLVSIYN